MQSSLGHLLGGVVRGLQPLLQFGVDLLDVLHPHAMADHRVEAARGLESLGWGGALQLDPHIDSRLGRWLEQRELLAAADTDIRLFGSQIDVLSQFTKAFTSAS